ncbi:MAG TPA: NYN domain-containing protein [Gemmatimonadaceae bacterium]|nr:NYN domain-containing protein [Gemmatimonadaceae bacterium]
MNSRHSRTPTRSASALIHRGPQAMSAAPQYAAPIHAPNAALLIDFDNVTMGIRSDLGKELRSLLSSEIIKGKVAVQRAYADWRRYPQYIVPLTEASIDLIYAPAYGSSKKNATDIRLAIDALELVFVRPEIGTFILLSGDSDFSSLVIKLKEYGKYVIGVGIRESSSDLLVMNCDEYYSYNALAGLVKASDEEAAVRKYDPWELVTEAVQRMKRNNDVMRSDRLKQVMQEIDNTFDEKNLGISKFSRFCQEAAQRGLLSVTKLDNGQLEVDYPGTVTAEATVRAAPQAAAVAAPGETGETPAPSSEERGGRRGRRGRGGRGRDREDREPRGEREPRPTPIATDAQPPVEDEATPTPAPIVEPHAVDVSAGSTGERLTRQEAFDLLRRTVADLVPGDESVRASDVRARARQLLGRDSESLSDRMFVRILKDAHDEGIIDLRRRGNDFEVARAAEGVPVAEQLAKSEQRATPAPSQPSTPGLGAPRFGMGPRGARQRGRPSAPPPELLNVGVVDIPAPVSAAAASAPASANGGPPSEESGRRPKRGRGGGRAKVEAASGTAEAAPAAKAKRAGGAKKAPRRSGARAKKGATQTDG